MATWIFIGHSQVAFDKERMTQYLNLTFASSMDVALQHFPKENGKPSLGLFKELVSDFVICGRTTSGDIWDISRTGMIKNASEFKEFVFTRLNMSLGALGGTPAARAAAKVAARKASAKAKAKSTASEKRKDNFVGAYSSSSGRAPQSAREPVDVTDAVELTFGDDQDRAPDGGVASPSSGELRAPAFVPGDPCAVSVG